MSDKSEMAFPVTTPMLGVAQPGMTLRDWFAGQALAGMLADNGDLNYGHAAREAYAHADAMLKARQP